MKKVLKSKFNFRTPSNPVISQEITNNFQAYVKRNLSSETKLNILSIKEFNFKGSTFYLLAHNLYGTHDHELKMLPKQYEKLQRLLEVVAEVDKHETVHRYGGSTKIRTEARNKGSVSLRETLHSSLDVKNIRDRMESLMVSLERCQKEDKKTYYALYSRQTSGRNVITNETIYGYHLLNRSIDKAMFKDYLSSYWDDTEEGRKSSLRARQKGRALQKTQRRTNWGTLQLVGGVHLEENSFIKLHQVKVANLLRDTKYPMTPERHIGVEIEASIPEKRWEELKSLLTKSKVGHYLCLGTDGSVTSDDNYKGGELRVCAPTSKIEGVIEIVCNALQKVRARVDASCGLHVHLDARQMTDSSGYQMFKNLVRQQYPLYLTQPASRRGNEYCMYSFNDDWESDVRYKAINPVSFRKYQTIEVRLHSGTIITSKINNWIRLLEMIAYGPALKTSYQTVDGLLKGLENQGHLLLTENLKEYFIKRAEKFSDAPEPVMSEDDNDYENYGNGGESGYEVEEEWPFEDFESEDDDAIEVYQAVI